MAGKVHIDDAQPATIDEHLRLLTDDDTVIEPKFTEVSPADLPDWFDEKLFKLGQDYYKRNLLGMAVASVMGLISILSVPEIFNVLTLTNASSSACTAFTRYLQTVLHTHMLFFSDINDPNSKYYKSLNVIRWKHSTSSKKATKAKIGGISHKSMAITQFGFIGFSLISPTAMGLSNRPEEREAFNHFWRVTGHLLGISDRLNVCRKTAEETTVFLRRLARDILAKNLENPEPKFVKLSRHALEGFWYIDIAMDPDAFLAMTYEHSGVKYPKPLGWYSWLNMKFREYTLYMCTVPVLGFLVRTYFNWYLLFNYWVIPKFPLAAWWAFGKSRTRIHLYPKYN